MLDHMTRRWFLVHARLDSDGLLEGALAGVATLEDEEGEEDQAEERVAAVEVVGECGVVEADRGVDLWWGRWERVGSRPVGQTDDRSRTTGLACER